MPLQLVHQGCWLCSTMRARSQVGAVCVLCIPHHMRTLQEDDAVRAGACSDPAMCTIVACTQWALELSSANLKLQGLHTGSDASSSCLTLVVRVCAQQLNQIPAA